MNLESEFSYPFELQDGLDIEILMHRDAHWGGLFSEMIAAYENEEVGTNEDFDLERLHYLAQVEKEKGVNLAALLLKGADAERVARAKAAYKRLRDMYLVSYKDKPIALLISDLILAESENPQSQIEALVAKGEAAAPALIALLKEGEFYDPLFPGYGLAPGFAALTLGYIGSEKAIGPLFDCLGEDAPFIEEKIIESFALLKEKTLPFLWQRLKSQPINSDNHRSAMLLAAIPDTNGEISKGCFAELKNLDMEKHKNLASYLVMACVGLQKEREEFKKLAQTSNLPIEIAEEMLLVIKGWDKRNAL